MFRTRVAAGVLQVAHPGTRWLVTGPSGGYRTAPAAYNVSVPDGFERTDVARYVTERRERAGFERDGPGLLTGVDLSHARGARSGPVAVVATVGLSNPAALPMDPTGERTEATGPDTVGTVNLVVGTTRALDEGGLATLLGTAVEAKAATLVAGTGFPGTTSDAVIVGAASAGEPATFAGSATQVGAATRACVREAVTASLQSRYAGRDPPDSVADAEHGVRTDREATVFTPGESDRDT